MQNIKQLHDDACEQGIDTYVDLTTGYRVLTRKALIKHGKYCGNCCRHCPYGHVNVPKLAGDRSSPII